MQDRIGLHGEMQAAKRNKRSHFDGQDFLENGGSASSGDLTSAGDGWLNRMLTLMPGSNVTTAFSVGRQRLLMLEGAADTSSWSPDSDMDLSPTAQALLNQLYAKDPLFHESAQVAIDLSEKMDGT